MPVSLAVVALENDVIVEVIFWLIVGVLGSAGLVKFIHKKPPESRLNSLGYALVIASLIYLVFAVLSTNMTWIGIELIGVLLYCIFFFLSKSYGVYLLAFGWLLHPVWDITLHLFGEGASFTPRGYAIMCISFDMMVAIYLLLQARRGIFCNDKGV